MIKKDKYWSDTSLNVEVRYVPIYGDGSRGHTQQCYLPWEGARDISKTDLELSAQRYFQEKYGPGQDDVVSARLWDREARDYV